jgi:hypothetical protein
VCKVYKCAGLVGEARRLLRHFTRAVLGRPLSPPALAAAEAEDTADDASWAGTPPTLLGGGAADGSGQSAAVGSGDGGLDAQGCVCRGGAVLACGLPAVERALETAGDEGDPRWLGLPAATAVR